MTDTDIRIFYDCYLAALNARDFRAMHEFIHDEVTLNGVATSRDGILAIQRQDAQAVPDLCWNLIDLIVDGNRLGARLLNTGTPVSTFVGINPTGKGFEVSQYAVYQVIDGRFKHMAAIRDAHAIAQQLAI